MIVTTHLIFNRNRSYLKFLQLLIILKTLSKIKREYKVDELIMGGDFNMAPNSNIYYYLTQYKLDFEAELSSFSNQNVCYKQKIENLEYILKILNLKFDHLKGEYKMFRFLQPNNLHSFNEYNNKINLQDNMMLKNLVNVEKLLTLVPIFPESINEKEIIFCNNLEYSENIIKEISSHYYNSKEFNIVQRFSLKKSFMKKYKTILSDLSSRLSKEFKFKSSYSEVKTSIQLNEGDNITTSISNNDVTVSQYSQDVKGILYFLINN